MNPQVFLQSGEAFASYANALRHNAFNRRFMLGRLPVTSVIMLALNLPIDGLREACVL